MKAASRPARLWGVVGLTIVLWLVHLVGMAVLDSTGCAGIGVASLHLLTVVTFVPTAGLAIVAWRQRDAQRGASSLPFLADLAAVTAAINAVAIVGEWLPVFALPACTGG